MKRSLGLVFGLLLLVQTQANAGVGLHGGLNFADTEDLSALKVPTNTNFILGAFYETEGDIFHFQPEFNYIKKQYANYITIPILLKLKIESPVFRPFIVAGPAIALNVNGPGANGVDLSLDLGAGLEVEVLPKFSVVAEGRYSLGFLNVSSTAGRDIKSRDISVMLGVHFQM